MVAARCSGIFVEDCKMINETEAILMNTEINNA